MDNLSLENILEKLSRVVELDLVSKEEILEFMKSKKKILTLQKKAL